MNVFEDMMQPLFSIVESTQGVEQEYRYHPEGDVFVHSLQTLWWAFRESYDTDLILAALLHDVGKKVNRLGHDKEGAEIIKPFVSVKTGWLVRQHMRIWYFIDGEMKKLSKVKELANHPWLSELTLLARWDKAARNPNKKVVYDRQYIIDRLNDCAEKHFINKKGEEK